ncbi:MAG: iron-sulfur cluster repair di-iron protein [Algisphaera sp.]
MNNNLTSQSTVGQWIAQFPQWSVVFEQLNIDYCCGGKKPLDAACKQAGLDADTLVTALKAAAALPLAAEPNSAAMTLTQLADHIEQTHHAYLRQALPAIHQMSARVADRHGENNPALRQLFTVFDALCEELSEHMLKEERILFPIIRQLDAQDADAQKTAAASDCGSVSNPITQMEHEHDNAGQALAKMSELTNGFVIPQGACKTYTAMLQAMASFEQDMHRHIHKENNVLFPRAAQREAELLSAAAS